MEQYSEAPPERIYVKPGPAGVVWDGWSKGRSFALDISCFPEQNAYAVNFLTQRQLNTIRGKAVVGHATPKEIMSVFEHLDCLEMTLDETEGEDFYGTEGWRQFFGLPDAD